MNIGFHSNQLGLRGTEVALYDYADFNETILNNKSVIISDKNHPNLERLTDFQERFPTELYSNFSEVTELVTKHNLDAIFYIKHGANDGKVVPNAKNWIQTVFRVKQPHGDAYFYNSPWLADCMGSKDWLPHIVRGLPDVKEDYRDVLGIPKDHTVFGFHGGRDSFNIKFAQKVIELVAQQDNKISFVFMNIDQFSSAKNIYHVAGTTDLETKSAFINTCDAMIYARECGETFGLSVAEFSAKNKPVILYADSPERHHISVLREAGIYYRNADELYNILINFSKFPKSDSVNYDKFSAYYSPLQVMTHFDRMLIHTV